eukprot:comp22987_c0_seq1/m.36595 comp22987_c0_seq1/g.36595  ORF comp22987_c0_seq1/g.36595 comp22987_c0_seq1/m.36595 type:complete len:500 (-) comp22987_c0_seq1:65-1564(-)
MGFLSRCSALLCAFLLSAEFASADKKLLARLKELIENDDAVTILQEKDTLSSVINMGFTPATSDCEATALTYAVIKHANKALAALLEVPRIEPTKHYIQADNVNKKYPRMFLLHAAALATSSVSDTNPNVHFAKKALCDTGIFKPDQETWDVLKTIPDLDPSQLAQSFEDKAVVLRYAHCSPLHYAAMTSDGSIAVTNLLGMKDVDVNNPECVDGSRKDRYTPVQLATLADNAKAVAAFLKLNDRVLDAFNENEESMLHTAVQMGYPSAVQAIVSTPKGSALASKPDRVGYSPLHVAAIQAYYQKDNPSYAEIVKILLPHMNRETVNAKTTDGYLHHVVSSKLIGPGKTALMIMAIGNRSDLVEVLINEGKDKVDPNAADGDSGFTPLHMAAQFNHANVAKLLLTHPEIDAMARTTAAKRPALVTACKAGAVDTVKVLLADPRTDSKAVDTNGYSGRDWATGWIWGNEKIIALFDEHEGVVKKEGKAEEKKEEEKKEEL